MPHLLNFFCIKRPPLSYLHPHSFSKYSSNKLLEGSPSHNRWLGILIIKTYHILQILLKFQIEMIASKILMLCLVALTMFNLVRHLSGTSTSTGEVKIRPSLVMSFLRESGFILTFGSNGCGQDMKNSCHFFGALKLDSLGYALQRLGL